MATTIQLLHSLTAGNRPGDLAPGEIAYNVADGFVYLGNGSNQYTDTLGNSLGNSAQPGGGWQQAIYNASPVTGSVILAGIYDAQNNEVTSVTPAGATAGFTVGDPLPAAAAGNDNYYVLVQIGGVLTAPAPVGETANPGDWIVSTGAGWSLVVQSSGLIPAQNIVVTPTGWITATNMQSVLNEIVLNVITGSGGVVANLEVNPGDLSVYGNTTLGDNASDSTIVSGTLQVGASSSFTGAAQFNGPIQAFGAVTAQNNLTVVGTFATNGSNTLGNNVSDTTLVSGPFTANTTATVQGATTLNGALNANGSVVFAGTVLAQNTVEIANSSTLFNCRAQLAAFTNNVQLGDTSVDTLTVYATETHSASETHNGLVTFNANVNFNNAGVSFRRSGETTNTQMQQLFVQPGTIIAHGGTSTLAGYLPCDGSAVSRTTYALLFGAIGTTWGGGDGSTTFNVPDLRGMFLRGAGANGRYRNAQNAFPVGPAVGSGQVDAFLTHSHTITVNTGDYAANYRNARGYVALPYFQQNTSDRVGAGDINLQYPSDPNRNAINNTGDATETRPVNVGVNYLIKF